MLASGVNVRAGRPNTDFGLGFYTTTLRRQAEDWAYLKHKAQPPMKRGQLALHPVVLWVRISRDVLARLQTLAFVRGDYGADEYWSFVQHCRASVPAAPSLPAVVRHHERGGTGTPSWYDMVSGPVAAFWQQRNAMSEADQFSFHTDAAQSAINDVLAGRRGTDYDVTNVPF
ncbi:MAG: hypothetical protein JWP03_5158 [Phycisphaerales bacterium]|nr:hypothetical protein [Phycisphaerales bacterium]